jgi:hypothetical protein
MKKTAVKGQKNGHSPNFTATIAKLPLKYMAQTLLR